MTSVFFSYSHKDEALRDTLETHLAMLKRQGVIDTWHDRRIVAGEEIDNSIDEHLANADVVLLLISSDFLASDYCYMREAALALRRHTEGKSRVIPVILRPCDWKHPPLDRLLAVPTDGKAITMWPNIDEAFLDVTKSIRNAVGKPNKPSKNFEFSNDEVPQPAPAEPRSSNLRLRKVFTEEDKDRFLEQAFEYMTRFFENSLTELQLRNPTIRSSFRRTNAHSFTATIYENGAAQARCRVRLRIDRGFGEGITYSSSLESENSYNECLTAENDSQSLFLKPAGLAAIGRREEINDQLSMEGAAEFYWALLIDPLQE
jgi:hypothetical protein